MRGGGSVFCASGPLQLSRSRSFSVRELYKLPLRFTNPSYFHHLSCGSIRETRALQPCEIPLIHITQRTWTSPEHTPLSNKNGRRFVCRVSRPGFSPLPDTEPRSRAIRISSSPSSQTRPRTSLRLKVKEIQTLFLSIRRKNTKGAGKRPGVSEPMSQPRRTGRSGRLS